MPRKLRSSICFSRHAITQNKTPLLFPEKAPLHQNLLHITTTAAGGGGGVALAIKRLDVLVPPDHGEIVLVDVVEAHGSKGASSRRGANPTAFDTIGMWLSAFTPVLTATW